MTAETAPEGAAWMVIASCLDKYTSFPEMVAKAVVKELREAGLGFRRVDEEQAKIREREEDELRRAALLGWIGFDPYAVKIVNTLWREHGDHHPTVADVRAMSALDILDIRGLGPLAVERIHDGWKTCLARTLRKYPDKREEDDEPRH